MWMSSLLETSRMGLHPLIIVDVKNLLETRIGLDPLMSATCGCQPATSIMGLHTFD